MDRPEIILAPGPTPIPPEVLLAQGSPLVYHRGPGFGNLMRDVTDRLRELYRTDAAEIFLMTSSGTGGLESAIQNCFSPGDEVFVPLAGFFSQRWQRLAEAYGLTVHTTEDEWGTRIDPAKVADALAAPPGHEGGAADAVRDLDRRDPADRGSSRGWRTTRACSSSSTSCPRSAPSRSSSTAGASTSRSAGRRRRCRRAPASRSSAVEPSRGGRRRDGDDPAVLLRLARVPALRVAAAPREPVDAGDQRDAGAARRADAVLPGRRRRGARAPPRCSPAR